MKNKSLLSVLVAGGILMAGCGNTEDTKKEDKPETEQTDKATQEVDLSSELSAYQQFALEQMDQFLLETEKFVNLVKAGDIEGAKAAYAPARMYFERSEPIAESFGDLDPRIDGRLADIQEEGKGEEEWSGYHKLEYALWEENTTKGYEAVADQLLADAKELHALVQTVEVTPDLMITGAVDLLNEVSTSKITGEEEIYSHTDLYDFKANIEGAEKIFEILRSKLEAKDSTLVTTLDEKFKAVDDLLAQHATADGGYVSYEELTEDHTKALAAAVNQLGEPLSQMGIILE
ncbi:EfeM/EfeO family lipoprotein [Lysinibacillus fusiformis]|jgi:iron uptake system component EfeO|uniref:iron uptake system protein EfeO n=1 Tax=Lysinibacillus TaxID=400634 RepID=UPI0004DA4136|nr:MULTISPECIES: iron uptake system protein EfeO [Lysinibacillus]MDC6266304.1 imelysin family protein [Lysinibacillus sphaericus]AJK88279.1 iron ABC transporter substrate-binding protein [Lysinibacillus fusiformis]KGA84187.1 iron ABC transporter substrate-binding protein [Lysinibacillus fusiformis]KHK49998.1 iron ABC transporter substrate-binding protein [Lysinibacillus sp. A1]MDN4970178.1 iron uptake system protein EfeO [Lysinibacillus fusiformis]